MTRLEALIDLRDDIKANEFDATVFDAAFPKGELGTSQLARAVDAFRGSLDAAFALHEAVLPDEGWHVEWAAKYPNLAFKPAAWCASVGWGTRHAAYADNPARAWFTAIIEALIAQERDA